MFFSNDININFKTISIIKNINSNYRYYLNFILNQYKMSFTSDKGGTILLTNKRPRNLSQGGMIKPTKYSYQLGNQRILNDQDEDTIRSNLPSGSIVIPRSIVPLMKEYTGKITGPKTNKKLMPVIVQSDEMVIHPKYANQVMSFLKSRGVSLPLKDSFF